METFLKGFYLGIVLVVLALNSGCGSSPGPQSSEDVIGNQVVVTIFNSGTQDPAFGTRYVVQNNSLVTLPSVILRTQGTTDQNGIGVGVDFGNGLGQCYYSGDMASQSVFTLSTCTSGLTSGQIVSINRGQTITIWSYNHVNSSDSIVELVLQGTLN